MQHGEWLPMLKEIGIDGSMARRLMQIGEKLNHRNCGDLPTSARALCELSRIDPDDLERGIAEGAVTPDMASRLADKKYHKITTYFQNRAENG